MGLGNEPKNCCQSILILEIYDQDFEMVLHALEHISVFYLQFSLTNDLSAVNKVSADEKCIEYLLATSFVHWNSECTTQLNHLIRLHESSKTYTN